MSGPNPKVEFDLAEISFALHDDTGDVIIKKLPHAFSVLGVPAEPRCIVCNAEPAQSFCDEVLAGRRAFALGEPKLWTLDCGNQFRSFDVVASHAADTKSNKTLHDLVEASYGALPAPHGPQPLTLEDLVRKSGLADATPSAPAPLAEDDPVEDGSEPAQDCEPASDERIAEFVRENLAEIERQRRRSARPIQRSAVDRDYQPFRASYADHSPPAESRAFRDFSPRRGQVLYDHPRSGR